MTFCRYGQRTLNAPNFYQYLLWRGQDLLFLSNRLPTGVGIECGFDDSPPSFALASNRVTDPRRRDSGSSTGHESDVTEGGDATGDAGASRTTSPAATGSSISAQTGRSLLKAIDALVIH